MRNFLISLIGGLLLTVLTAWGVAVIDVPSTPPRSVGFGMSMLNHGIYQLHQESWIGVNLKSHYLEAASFQISSFDDAKGKEYLFYHRKILEGLYRRGHPSANFHALHDQAEQGPPNRALKNLAGRVSVTFIVLQYGLPFQALSSESQILFAENATWQLVVAPEQLWGAVSVPHPWRYGSVNLPLVPSWSGFVLNTGIYTALVLLMIHLYGKLLRRRRLNRGLCPSCRYTLAGLTPGTPCPECGAPVLARPQPAPPPPAAPPHEPASG